jgi:dipeptidyl-peptidase 4
VLLRLQRATVWAVANLDSLLATNLAPGGVIARRRFRYQVSLFRVALFLAAALLPYLALEPCLAQQHQQQHQRQQRPGIYGDSIDPHWFGDGTRFWYRSETGPDQFQFFVVDAQEGTRKTAFDHNQIASAISTALDRRIEADSLPIDGIEFSDDEKRITLKGNGRSWLLNLDSNELVLVGQEREKNDSPLFLPERNSRDAGPDTEFLIKNELESDVELVWITGSGQQQTYGIIHPGTVRRQHTFAGHAWLLLDHEGEKIGAFVAKRINPELRLNAKTLSKVDRRASPLLDSNPRSESDRPQRGLSPDGQWSVSVRNHQLWIQRIDDSIEPFPLTIDATKFNTFQKDPSWANHSDDHDLQDGMADAAADAHWSPDSRYLLAFQTVPVEERTVTLIESSPRDQLQPKLQSFPYAKPGDPLPVSKPHLFDITHRCENPISDELFPNPWELRFLRWSDSGDRCFLLYNQRGHQVLRVLEIDTSDGSVRSVIDESSSTFIHYSTEGKFELHWLPNGQILWASERSGWNHLYRYEIATGQVINAVTSGDWNVRRIEHIDSESGLIWFFAVGMLDDQDPYHEHFCRVRFDGSGLTVLTDADATHEITWSPDRRFFIDRYSRVDLPPVHELRDGTSGRRICELERADASEILDERRSFPERFVAKGRDGQTDIWGIIHRPRTFDPGLRYPVIENIYAGPHDHHVPKKFQSRYRHQHRIADLGFIVVQIDGMGTAWRSKKFHDVCYRNLRDAGFLDRIAWLKAAGQKFPEMDLSRVGIYGGSAGGQNAMAALLWHGDFYQVAVADCGCHDNRMDKIWWNEQWMGWPVDESYSQNSNTENAHLLEGRLLLIVGELDRNVDPSTTLQVARKLIEADKDFELLVVPGVGHGAAETPWASRRRSQFFHRHLLGNDLKPVD